MTVVTDGCTMISHNYPPINVMNEEIVYYIVPQDIRKNKDVRMKEWRKA